MATNAMIEKDAKIRVAGILQAVIASGIPPTEWEKALRHGLKLHSKYSRAVIEGKMPPFIPTNQKETKRGTKVK